MARKQESRYHRRPDGLLETTRTDKRTGKRIHFYGRSGREIERQIMEFSAEQDRGRLFKAVAEEWHDLHWPTLAYSTAKGYNAAYQRALDEFGREPIRQIKPQDIKRFITDFARGNRSKKTVTNQLLLLSLICGYAVGSGDIDYSPCDHISVPRHLTKTRREAATPEEERAVKASADVWLFPFFILYSGLRKGEALALTWGDIDFDGEKIYITKSVYYEGDRPKLKRPKTEAGRRVVPLLSPLKAELEKIPKRSATDYIFSDTGESPLTDRRYRTLWSAWAKQSGVTATAHQLRHSFATTLFECGVDVKDAQDILGHSTAAVTQDIYTHIRESRRKLTAKILNEKMAAAAKSEATEATE